MLNILLAVDGSEPSLRAAAALSEMATWWTVRSVRLLNVQPEPSPYGELLPHAMQQRADAVVRAAGERALSGPRGALSEAALPVTYAVEFGEPAAVIARTAEQFDCDFIAMGSHGAGAVRHLFAGSVAIKVLHLSRRPVLVVPSARPRAASAHGPPHRPVRILIAVDGSAGSDAALREVVRIAPSFAVPPETHLLAIYDRTPVDVELGAMLSAKMLADHEQRRFEAALEPARRVLAEAKLAAIEHTAIGPPAQKVHAAVSENLCDLVCVGTRGMGTVRNLVLGSTAVKVLHTAEVPVLVVPASSSVAP